MRVAIRLRVAGWFINTTRIKEIRLGGCLLYKRQHVVAAYMCYVATAQRGGGAVSDSEYLVEIVCSECGEVMYFPVDSLPGGDEHCPYCEECGAALVIPEAGR